MLLDKSGTTVKLIDFGLAAFFKPGRKLTEVCGSKRFQAPEVYRKSNFPGSGGYEGPPVDVWSCGVVLFELVHGQIRMSGADAKITTGEFIEKSLKKHLKEKTFSPELVALLRGTLQLEPKRRLSTQEILIHPWLKLNGCAEK
jgi:serine/threonine protein kinase